MTVTTIGIISDTHRHLPDKALDIFLGRYDEGQIVNYLVVDGDDAFKPPHKRVDEIIHAGDIGELEPLSQGILDDLGRIAPVHAVLGNRDVEGYAVGGTLVSQQMLQLDICGAQIAVAHKPEDLNAAISASGADPLVRIHGHTHIPKLERRGRGIVICPGAIHKPKGDWPMRTVSLLHLEESGKLLGASIMRI